MATLEETTEAAAPERPKLDWVVFAGASVLVVAVALMGIVIPEQFSGWSGAALTWILDRFTWLFVLMGTGMLGVMIFFGATKYGKLRLGRDDERPQFRTSSWIAMMFSAGMGIGLVFFGVHGPVSHYLSPPRGLAESATPEAAALSMQYTFFHYALTPWAIYGAVGLVIGYSTMRKGRPNLISATLVPLFGDRMYGPLGKMIDIFAIWATLFGTCTSLGYGAAQMNAGLNFVWDVPVSNVMQVIIIVVLTVLFILSATTGVEKGVQFLSNANMLIAIALAIFVFLLGPVVYIVNMLVEGTGDYLFNLIPMSFETGISGGSEWISAWTVFFWAWWLAWTPFVGTFLARISRGRTIREYVIGVMIVPSAVSLVWFAIFGGAGIDAQASGAADLSATASELSLFVLLETYPFAAVTAAIVVFLVGLFFVSGADAASVVMGTMSTGGSHHPPATIVATWGALTGAAAAGLLLAGGLQPLQDMTIVMALPFVVVIILMCLALYKEARLELPSAFSPVRPQPQPPGDPLVDAKAVAVGAVSSGE